MCFNSCKPPGDTALQRWLSLEGCRDCGAQHFQHKCQKLTRIFGQINCSDSNIKTLNAREKVPRTLPQEGKSWELHPAQRMGEKWQGRGRSIQVFVHLLKSWRINSILKAQKPSISQQPLKHFQQKQSWNSLLIQMEEFSFLAALC